jgi:signal peptidase I
VGRRPSRTLLRGAILVAASIVTFGWILTPIRTYGPSMLPTYREGSLYFVAIRLAGPHVLFVKRVLGLPGERLLIRRGIVHVDGAPLEEPYVAHRAPWIMREKALGTREYFVAGDNRGMRIEQHELGAVDRERIVGRLLW